MKAMSKWHIVSIAVVPVVTIARTRCTFFKCKSIEILTLPSALSDLITEFLIIRSGLEDVFVGGFDGLSIGGMPVLDCQFGSFHGDIIAGIPTVSRTLVKRL